MVLHVIVMTEGHVLALRSQAESSAYPYKGLLRDSKVGESLKFTAMNFGFNETPASKKWTKNNRGTHLISSFGFHS